jgi:hypothetical protein
LVEPAHHREDRPGGAQHAGSMVRRVSVRSKQNGCTRWILHLGHGLWLSTIFVLFSAWAASPASAAECASAPNPIVCENALPGDAPSDWQVRGAGDPTIQGFATSLSVNAGQKISFKINTPASSNHIDILRFGYYCDDRERIVDYDLKTKSTVPQSQLISDRIGYRAHRLRQLGRSGVRDPARKRRLRALHRPSGTRRHRRREPDLLRRA